MQTIYVEKDIQQHPRVLRILNKFKNARVIVCKHYGEVFNRKNQNFRLQKEKPALILAQKAGTKVLAAPEGFGIGGSENYYFSHMLNCIYDCRYCFLQGMYPSAHYVLFVNFEDFMDEITTKAQSAKNKPAYFFSGYDCDSLALDNISEFLPTFLPFFAKQQDAILELRTKSASVNELLNHTAFDNCVAAFSFTPQEISRQIEHKVPEVAKRIDAMKKLAQQGWKLGLRFDPLIYADNFKELYQHLVDSIFAEVPAQNIHSVSVGPLRFPIKMFEKVKKLYPQEKLFAYPMEKREGTYSYKQETEHAIKAVILESLSKYLNESLIFECHAL